MADFTHLDDQGKASMVDVSAKSETLRKAVAKTSVYLSRDTFDMLADNNMPKGDVFSTARIAGIMAGKRTHELIPLCHPLPLTFLGVEFEMVENRDMVEITAEARTTAKTGVEMEAVIAAQIAAATIYDMCKAVQKDIVISDTRLVFKSGGKSGIFEAK